MRDYYVSDSLPRTARSTWKSSLVPVGLNQASVGRKKAHYCARCCRRDYAEQIAEFEVALHTKCVEASSRAQTTCPPLTWQCVDFKNRIITISKSGGYSLRSDELADDTNCCHSEEQQRWVRTSICLLSPRAWF